MSQDPSIRCPTHDDARAVRDAVAACPPLDLHTPYTYWTLCAYTGGASIVADVDGAIVGCALGFHATQPAGGAIVFLWQIAVTEPHRRTGLAHRMTSAFIDRAISAGCQDLQVTIAADNGPSLALMRGQARSLGRALRPIGATGTLDGLMGDEVVYTMALGER